jgi:hypothetical protein
MDVRLSDLRTIRQLMEEAQVSEATVWYRIHRKRVQPIWLAGRAFVTAKDAAKVTYPSTRARRVAQKEAAAA